LVTSELYPFVIVLLLAHNKLSQIY